MKPSSVRKSPRSLNAALLILGAMALTASSAVASTAANTVITNTATVNYNDAGGAAQTAVTASAAVTVSLVPSAVVLSSPGPQTIAQGTSATLTYTITSTANGPDLYNLASTATPNLVTAVTPGLPPNINLGGTTLAVAAAVGDPGITVPYDGVAGATVNGIGPGSTIVVGGNPYTVAAAGVSKNAVTNTATITLTGPIATLGQGIGTVVGERKTFTATVASGTVTAGNTTGTQTVSTTATSASAPNPATTQGTATVITVQRPSLTVTKLVSTDNGTTFVASANAAPGTVLIYKITATNAGSTSATSVAFTDTLPAYLTYQPGTGKFAAAASTYAGATALVDNGGGGYTVVGSTVAYNPGGATGTVAGGGVLILFFKATIN